MRNQPYRSQGFYCPGGGGSTPPPTSVEQTGWLALNAGTSQYTINFSPAFASAPSFISAQVQMPNSTGETFEVGFDLSTLTVSSIELWLSGTPSAASAGGRINWFARL